MKSPYTIQDILLQTSQLIVYRVHDENGHSLALTRLLFNEREQGKLAAGAFENALEALKQLNHSCLRRALDGGLDEIDGAPWIITQFWEGDPLKTRHEAGNFNYEGKTRLEAQARNLMEFLGGYAGALNFSANEVIDTKASDGSALETFTMDLREWLLGWIRGDELVFERNPELGLARLSGSLPVTAPAISPVAPVVTQPLLTASLAPQVPLSSASSGSPVGLIAILTLLAGGIGGGAWWAMKDKEDKAASVEVAMVEEVEKKPAAVKEEISKSELARPVPQPEVASGPKQVSVSEPEVKLPISEKPEKVEGWLENRPDEGAIDDVSATDLEERKKQLDNWIYAQGRVAEVTEEGRLIFEVLKEGEAALEVELQGGEMPEVQGKDISVVGRLKTADLLIAPDASSIEILEEGEIVRLKEFYTVEDEETIKTLEGEKITLKATVLRSEASGSEKTIYLIFTDVKPFLAAAISNKPEEHGIDMEYFESLIGKEVSVTGIAEAESRDRRFIFRIFGKDDLKVE